MNLNKRLDAFVALGKRLQQLDEETVARLSRQAASKNNWFTEYNVKKALEGVIKQLDEQDLRHWIEKYNIGTSATPKKVGIVMAGNIPLVGFHDFLCVLLAGHEVYAKVSSQDPILPPFVGNMLLEIEPGFAPYIHFEERLNMAEVMIATGSDNSSRYFNYYFGKMPHIIRQNRTSVAVLTGKETSDDFCRLADDIFIYFGLGCRNVSKIYVPENYTFDKFYEAIEDRAGIREHHKYNNNYDYNKSIYLINSVPHLDNGFLILTENKSLVSPISVLYYERYQDESDLALRIQQNRQKIQCIVSKNAWYPQSLSFGEAQQPNVWDYADGVDTMAFLIGL
jgi:hypothetical protein